MICSTRWKLEHWYMCEDDTDQDVSEFGSEELAQSSGTGILTSSGSLQELTEMDDSEGDAVSEDGDEEVHTIETGSDLGNNGIIEKFIISLQTDSI